MTNLIILILVSLVLLFGIYLAVKDGSKLMKFGASAFALMIVSEIVYTAYLIIA